MGRGRPVSLGSLGRPLPGHRHRRVPQKGPVPAQVPHGSADPGTPAGPARPGRLRRPPAAGGRRAAQRRAGHDPGRAVHRRRADPATVGNEDQDDRAHLGRGPGTSTGKRRDLTFEEHRAFWTWATVEVLRHTGIRIEELTELSHHSLIQYRLPTTGELVPLLQIAPSKTDTERLLVISPELADVLSTIMSRIRDPGGKV